MPRRKSTNAKADDGVSVNSDHGWEGVAAALEFLEYCKTMGQAPMFGYGPGGLMTWLEGNIGSGEDDDGTGNRKEVVPKEWVGILCKSVARDRRVGLPRGTSPVATGPLAY